MYVHRELNYGGKKKSQNELFENAEFTKFNLKSTIFNGISHLIYDSFGIFTSYVNTVYTLSRFEQINVDKESMAEA